MKPQDLTQNYPELLRVLQDFDPRTDSMLIIDGKKEGRTHFHIPDPARASWVEQLVSVRLMCLLKWLFVTNDEDFLNLCKYKTDQMLNSPTIVPHEGGSC